MEPEQDFDTLEMGEEAIEQGSKAIQLVGEGPKILIHSMAGILTLNTIQLLGSINGVLVEILVDLGSTYNFLKLLVAKQAKLKTDEGLSLWFEW